MPGFHPELPPPITTAMLKYRSKSIANDGEKSSQLPPSAELVAALQALEKQPLATPCPYAEMIGTWQLIWITGTQKARKKAGQVLSSGRFLPKWVSIQIRYTENSGLFQETTAVESAQETALSGSVENSVKLGAVELTLTGPVQFYHKRQILAFDFTRLQLNLFGRSIYQGWIRGGQAREAGFLGQTLKEQAFFKYFLIHPDCIAARGRGGGLALWVKPLAD